MVQNRQHPDGIAGQADNLHPMESAWKDSKANGRRCYPSARMNAVAPKRAATVRT